MQYHLLKYIVQTLTISPRRLPPRNLQDMLYYTVSRSSSWLLISPDVLIFDDLDSVEMYQLGMLWNVLPLWFFRYYHHGYFKAWDLGMRTAEVNFHPPQLTSGHSQQQGFAWCWSGSSTENHSLPLDEIRIPCLLFRKEASSLLFNWKEEDLVPCVVGYMAPPAVLYPCWLSSQLA